MKKAFLKIISCLLTLTLLFSFIPTSRIYANAASSQLEVIKEAMGDYSSGSPAGDWGTAIYKDGLYWGYFHNAVQNHIRSKDDDMEEHELPITYKNGRKGRADLLKIDRGYTYIWELKPLSYAFPPKLYSVPSQLSRYVNSNTKYRYGNTYGVNILSDSFIIGKYRVSYMCENNGLIFYWFDRAEPFPEKDPVLVPDPVPAEQEEKERIKQQNLKTANVVIEGVSYENIADYIKYVESIEAELKLERQETPVEIEEPDKVYISEDTMIAIKCAAESICAADFSFSILDFLAVYVMNYTSAKDLYNSALAVKTQLASISMMEKVVITSGAYTGTYFVISSDLYDDITEFFGYWELFSDDYDIYIDDEETEPLNPEDIHLSSVPLENIQNTIKREHSSYVAAEETAPQRDPLIIDLGEEGIKLTDVENGVYFDLDNNGFAEKTAWIGTEDGFLALDINGNGIIDNGGELFGDQFVMPDGNISETGFEALSSLDENHDGIIDENDAVFEQLGVWIDANHNGNTDENELKTLTESGIVSIDLNYVSDGTVNVETGTMEAESSFVTLNTGDKKKISEFWFIVNSSDTTHDGDVTVGNVPNFEQALANDENGKLLSLYIQFNYTDNIAQKRYYLKQILYNITGASDILPDSRGGNIDARDLHVIEQFMGREFDGVDGRNPNSNAAEILKAVYNNIENNYYTIMNLQSGFG